MHSSWQDTLLGLLLVTFVVTALAILWTVLIPPPAGGETLSEYSDTPTACEPYKHLMAEVQGPGPFDIHVCYLAREMPTGAERTVTLHERAVSQQPQPWVFVDETTLQRVGEQADFYYTGWQGAAVQLKVTECARTYYGGRQCLETEPQTMQLVKPLDLNGDGTIGGPDFLWFRSRFGDLNGDGVIGYDERGGLDLLDFRRGFGGWVDGNGAVFNDD